MATQVNLQRVLEKEAGYGYYMFFALDPSLYGSQVYRCQSVCKGLYDETLVYPSYYYKKNSTEREAINWLMYILP